MGRAATAIGMIATSEFALALRCGVSVQRTCSGTRTKPPPTPRSPPSKPPRNPIVEKTTRRSRCRFGLARDHGVVPELDVRRHCDAGLLRLFLLLGLAALFVASLSHGD